MTWLVTVTRDELVTDGLGEHRRSWPVRVTLGAPQQFATLEEAEAYRRRVLNAPHDPSLDVAIEQIGGATPKAGGHLPARTVAAGRQGLARARAALQREEPSA